MNKAIKITGKNELIKSLQQIIENLKARLMDGPTLKPSEIHRYLYTRNGNISQMNMEEDIITTPRLSQNDHTGQINKTHPTERGQQRCLKSMPRYEIPRVSRKNWKDPNLLR